MPPIFNIEKREEIKTSLLEAGVSFIKETGLRKLSVEKITKKVNIGKGTFYHFFDSKEQYVVQVIYYSKEKMYKAINEIVIKKGGIDKKDFLKLFEKFAINGTDNIIMYLTMEDEAWLKEKLPTEFSLNSKREEQITNAMFDKAIGVKKNIDYRIIANMMNIMALAVENKASLHSDVLDENLVMLINSLCDYIYE